MIGSPYNIILITIAFGAVATGLAAWVAALTNYIAMRSNRTLKASWPLRLLPSWYYLKGMLTPVGEAYRSRFIRWMLVFFASIGIFGIVLFGSLAYCGGQRDCLVVHLK